MPPRATPMDSAAAPASAITLGVTAGRWSFRGTPSAGRVALHLDAAALTRELQSRGAKITLEKLIAQLEDQAKAGLDLHREGTTILLDEAAALYAAALVGGLPGARCARELLGAFQAARQALEGWLEALRREVAQEAPGGRLPESFAEHERSDRARILAALEKHRWNKVAAATELGIPRRTFYRRLARYGIEG